MHRLIGIILLFVLSSFSIQAERQYSFLKVNNVDGLVNNHVTCIYKDTRGFVWIGTRAGLSRFDGFEFVNYKHTTKDTTTIIDNYIENIQEDNYGNLWIGTLQGYVVFDITKERFYRDLSMFIGQKDFPKNIENLYIDKNKQKWIKQDNEFYYQRVDSVSGKLYSVFPVHEKEECCVVNFQQASGDYYYLLSNGIIECYDGENYNLKFRNDHLSGKLGADSLSTSLFIDAENDIWLYGNNDGIYHYQVSHDEWNHYTIHSKLVLSSNIIRNIIQDDNGLIWVGTDHGGIDVINKFSGEVTKIYHQSDNDKSIAQNSITDLYIDDNNIIWIGTFKNGVSYYHESIHKFPHYRHVLSDPSSLPYNDVNCFVEDKKGNLWIGTNGGGLIYWNRHTNSFKKYQYDENNPNSLSNNIVVSLFIDSKNELWIGTYTGGLNRFNGKYFKRYQYGIKSTCGITGNNIWSITEDFNLNLWIGILGGGIVIYDRTKDLFKPVPNKGNVDLPTKFVKQIYKLNNGNFFIATERGVVFYDLKEQRYKHHPFLARSTPLPISNKTVNAVYEDTRGLLWIASREGLIVVNPNTGFVKNFTASDGLSEDFINCILEDEFQSIWVSKSSGLSQVVVKQTSPGEEYSFSIFDYTEEDGLQGKEFNTQAAYKTSKNELIFGGNNGFNMFQSKNIKYNQILPKVVFTDFQIFNQSIKPNTSIKNTIILKESITSAKSIELKYSMNVFSIDFTALNFFIPSKIKYQYKLDGFNDDWMSLDANRNRVTYTNLSPGDYYFKVKASNNDGIWNDDYAELHIIVLPPLYATPLAYSIYILLIVGILVYFRYSMLRKERVKFQKEQEQIQANRNHEMDEMKLRFLTNVSHEFRTPLTLILTPLDKLLKQTRSESDKRLLDTIERNAKQLLNLVNQLLDFRKLELHGLRYNPSYVDIVTFLNDVTHNFEDAFNKKRIKFTFEHSTEHFIFNFDKEKLEKVMMNLLSNALKFTHEKGNVKLKLEIKDEDGIVNIIIQDNGVGIDEEDIDKIFVRFYQSEKNKKLGLSGSGIGLNLAREMIQLHNGIIEVESERGKGAKFKVSLPIDKTVVVDNEDLERVDEDFARPQQESESSEKIKKPIILLVEDNIDFRSFMKETLQEQFKIYEAQDGQKGYDTVHKVLPDLIISDVMMPNVDGLELCTMLRKDIRTSHIPFILLTARTADEDKIKGLEIGADDYITKPFNMDLLLLRVRKLLEKRSQFQKQFQKTVDISPSEVQITSMDEKLIKKAVATVEKNISESKFSVEDLSRELGMSRVYLYKKLISITGKSPIEFIRIIRLKRGLQLLEKSQMNIAEIAYEVGFNSPRYFSKYFKEEYGILPTAYAKRHKEDGE
ncbi:two-component regulator propeller domain-containing protein [Labilibaculum manganireducens]|uniref:hybrid sensor histidine kinase/response regulator transcription factor n=1 Tax=Labilibaculum manganireducens TaxID=1940525 RepID=UPI0029F505AD|nr:two-component regulator propeller domain-containing protein [Labilibaculum manganireducens]